MPWRNNGGIHHKLIGKVVILKLACGIGGRKQVKQAKEDLQAKYKACRALIDELKNV